MVSHPDCSSCFGLVCCALFSSDEPLFILITTLSSRTVVILTVSVCFALCCGRWLIRSITNYLLHRSRDQHLQLLQRRAPGWTCRLLVPRGEPPCTPETLLHCLWKSRSRRNRTRSCLDAARPGSRTRSAGGWTARRFAQSVAWWRAGPGRPRACFSGVGLLDSWGKARSLFSCPCSAVCHPCSESLRLYRWALRIDDYMCKFMLW